MKNFFPVVLILLCITLLTPKPVSADTYSAPPITYEDAEDLSTMGWRIVDKNPAGAKINNVYDTDRGSRVIRFTGSEKKNSYGLKNGDRTPWNNSNHTIIEWSMKYSEPFQIFIATQTTNGFRYIYYTHSNKNKLGEGRYIHHGLGSIARDGNWHTFNRNLEADLHDAQPDNDLQAILGFIIRGSGRVDDIKTMPYIPWRIRDNKPPGAIIENVYDSDRNSHVTVLSGSGISNSYHLRNFNGTWWNDTDHTIIEWSMKYSESFRVYIAIQTTHGFRYLYYTDSNSNTLGEDKYIHHGLGSAASDGNWHTFTRNLEADLHDAQPDNNLESILGFLIRGSGRVDDITIVSNNGDAMRDGSYGAVAYKVRHSEISGREAAPFGEEERKSIPLICKPVESGDHVSFSSATVTLNGKFYPVRGQAEADWLPPDPGITGTKTMLGIDSDNDCVRDDIECLIVKLLPAANQKKARKYIFEYAKWRGQFLKNHYVDDGGAVKEISRNLYTTEECVRRILNDDVKSKEIIDRVFSKFHNTYSRSIRYIDNNTLLGGWSSREDITISCP